MTRPARPLARTTPRSAPRSAPRSIDAEARSAPRTPRARLAGGLLLAGLLLPGRASASQAGAEHAERVLWNGRIVTLDEGRPEAEALAFRGGRILAVGSRAEVEALVGPDTDVIDLAGALAVPGLIEGHGHFLGIGDARVQLALAGAADWDAIVAQVAAAVREAGPGELVRGRGWHQAKWQRLPEPAVQGLPVHASLSRISPEHPVVLRHASGHAAFANARAMELAGITRETPDPPGGEIVRDPSGEPTGVFREAAMSLLAPAYEGARPPDPRRLARLANEEVLSKGITSFQDAGSSLADVEVYRELLRAGELQVRLWVMLREPNEVLAQGLAAARVVGAEGGRLTVRAIKHAIDGALGSHGAWLLLPYADLPGSSGLNTTPVPVIEETARLALEHGYQLCVHAIGDRANHEALDLFERAFGSLPGEGGGRELRWRIEHAQHLDPADVPRFARLGVIASMQGIHCTSDAPFVLERLGEERARGGAYVWRDLLATGAVVTNGTDAPVEDVDPLASFHAMVTRRLADGTRFFPDQRLGRLEALRAATLANAYAAFEEQEKGSLVPGKLADVTVLSKDVLSVPEDEILEARVLLTIVGGEVVYRAP